MLDAAAVAVALSTANSVTLSGQIVTGSLAFSQEEKSGLPYTIWAEPGGERAEFSPEHMEEGEKYPVRLNGMLYVVEKTPDGDLNIYTIDESVA